LLDIQNLGSTTHLISGKQLSVQYSVIQRQTLYLPVRKQHSPDLPTNELPVNLGGPSKMVTTMSIQDYRSGMFFTHEPDPLHKRLLITSDDE
jgi:hypothetical protein